MEKCSWILVDVAGTTTSINFVKDTLYPLVTKQAADFLKSKWEVDEIKELVKKLKDNEELNVDAAAELIKTLTQENSENESLKTIQGLIYKHYYENGELKGHVFDDVPEAFEQWAKLKQLAIYSSGSIESQKLLYTHSLHGDLSGHILKYFDQSVGSKTEKESYEKIAKTLEVKPEEILFITDCTKEGIAAKSAGVNVNIITREGNSDIPEEEAKEFQVIASFKEVLLENPSKRKNDEEASAEEPPSKVTKTEGTPEEKTESMQVDNTATNNTQETAVETVKETEITADDKTDVAMNEVKPTEESGKEAETENAEKESAVDVVEDEKSETSEKKEEKTNPDMVAEKVTESPVEPEKNDSEGKTEGASKEVENTSETDKDESKEAKTDVQSEESVQTSDKPAEVVEPEEATTETKTEEKENKSDLANGVENGKKEEAEETDVAETKEEETEVKSDEVEIKKEETEVKLKKLEETTESKTVTVEV